MRGKQFSTPWFNKQKKRGSIKRSETYQQLEIGAETNDRKENANSGPKLREIEIQRRPLDYYDSMVAKPWGVCPKGMCELYVANIIRDYDYSLKRMLFGIEAIEEACYR